MEIKEWIWWLSTTSGGTGGGVDNILLEDGSNLLMEDGSVILLE